MMAVNRNLDHLSNQAGATEKDKRKTMLEL